MSNCSFHFAISEMRLFLYSKRLVSIVLPFENTFLLKYDSLRHRIVERAAIFIVEPSFSKFCVEISTSTLFHNILQLTVFYYFYLVKLRKKVTFLRIICGLKQVFTFFVLVIYVHVYTIEKQTFIFHFISLDSLHWNFFNFVITITWMNALLSLFFKQLFDLKELNSVESFLSFFFFFWRLSE